MIEHVTAVNGNDREAASEAIAGCDIMATAVGARILKFIVPNIVAGLRKRWVRTDAPLNIIICENLNDAIRSSKGCSRSNSPRKKKTLFDARVGLVEASIGRMVPVQTEEMKDGDPMRVCVERYGFLPVDLAAFKGEVPEIQNLVPFEPFDFYIKRKLFIHNMGHATCAYLGGYVGRKYIYQAIDDGRCAQRPQQLFHCIERRPPLTSFQCGNMPCSESDLFRKLFARHILPLAQFFQFFTETLL